MKKSDSRKAVTWRSNARVAKRLWHDEIGDDRLEALKSLTTEHLLCIATGDLQILDGRWYVTHTGLLGVARRNRCSGIHVEPVEKLCDPAISRWTFKATVFKSRTCRGFIGFGDADPSNTSSVVRGAEMRVAETRAVNRALRKAYGIGICSIEEIGSFATPPQAPAARKPNNGNGDHPLRDRLCLLIRKHGLDASLVKLYAADYCGSASLREATREQIQGFVAHLAQYADHDREGLLCQLNSYAPQPIAPVTEREAAPADGEKAVGAA